MATSLRSEHVLIELGIYPREPRNKRKASKSSTQSTTFYYSKDIQYLLHEPLLNKFREHKALSKKIARSLGRGEVGDAARLEKTGASKISLDHIIKERYPTFVDALRDLDDALSLLFLFANLPATSTVPPKTVALCHRLCLEFEHYLITSHSLRKSFLSIKGIYYQANIQGQDVLWLVPYKFVQRVTGDVDFRIMGTFVEFYTTLLGFVNFRLYTSIGLIYPPKFDANSDEQGGELGAFTLEGKEIEMTEPREAIKSQINGEHGGLSNGDSERNDEIQKRVDALGEVAEPDTETDGEKQESSGDAIDETIDTFETTGEGADVLPQPQISGAEASSLFAPFTFFLSRETPRQPLEFILRAFGCKHVGWDAVLGDGASTNNESDPTITHQVVDRPPLPVSNQPIPPVTSPPDTSSLPLQNLPHGTRMPGRIYVQPQWVWDCINSGRLLRPDLYAPGATLPPHLSPWMKPGKGTYDPSAPLAAQEREGEAEEAEEGFVEEDAQKAAAEQDASVDLDESALTRVPPRSRTTEAYDSDNSESASDADLAENGMAIAGSDSESDTSPSEPDDFDGFDSDAQEDFPHDEDDADLAAKLHQAELEAEAQGLPFSSSIVSAHPSSPSHPPAIKSILKNPLSSLSSTDQVRRKATRKRREEEEELERRKGMMGRKKRKVLEKMLFGKDREERVNEGLRAKRRRIERERGGVKGR